MRRIGQNAVTINKLEVQIEMCDITDERTDAIVNAANEKLAHSGGVAARILQAGGSMIQVESTNWVNVHGPIKTGECAYTSAGKMATNGVKYIIHAVGPEYNNKKCSLFNAGKLYEAVFNSLILANRLGCGSVAFPAISSGIFGFPKQLCA